MFVKKEWECCNTSNINFSIQIATEITSHPMYQWKREEEYDKS